MLLVTQRTQFCSGLFLAMQTCVDSFSLRRSLNYELELINTSLWATPKGPRLETAYVELVRGNEN